MSNVKDTAEAIKGIVEAVPVYEDALQPAVKELGKGVHTLAKLVNIALTPVSVLVWGYDQIRHYLETTLPQKLENTPSKNIIPPDPSIAVPTIEALRYTGNKKELRDMFINLLANSMDKETAPSSHPSFVEIIKQINSDEAKIITLLSTFDVHPIIKISAQDKQGTNYHNVLIDFSLLPYKANCEYPEQGPSYLENIARLGLANISYETHVVNPPNAYENIFAHQKFKEVKQLIESRDKRIKIEQGYFMRNDYGSKFYNTCILGK